jgi:hypothetical protein
MRGRGLLLKIFKNRQNESCLYHYIVTTNMNATADDATMTTLPFAVYHGSLPSQYEGRLIPVSPVRAYVNKPWTMHDFGFDVSAHAHDILREEATPDLEKRARDLFNGKDVDIVLIDEPQITQGDLIKQDPPRMETRKAYLFGLKWLRHLPQRAQVWPIVSKTTYEIPVVNCTIAANVTGFKIMGRLDAESIRPKERAYARRTGDLD